MNDETVTDSRLREFLLGKVSDEERERIESLFLTDPHARERVLGVEQDLIEDYLEDTLTGDDRERFVSRYAQTDDQRRKLRITKSIKDWAITKMPAEPVAVSRLRIWFKPAFIVPVAAVVLIAIVIAVIWVRTNSAIERELAQLNAPTNTTAASVQRELSPVTVRGAGPQTQISAAAGVVELRLIQKERYPSYTATIRRLDDRASYTVRNLQAGGEAVRLLLPAHFLTRGVWQITLTPDNAPTFSDEYQLAVGD